MAQYKIELIRNATSDGKVTTVKSVVEMDNLKDCLSIIDSGNAVFDEMANLKEKQEIERRVIKAVSAKLAS